MRVSCGFLNAIPAWNMLFAGRASRLSAPGKCVHHHPAYLNVSHLMQRTAAMRKPLLSSAQNGLRACLRLTLLEDRTVPATFVPGFAETPLATGLSIPTAMEFSPDGKL